MPKPTQSQAAVPFDPTEVDGRIERLETSLAANEHRFAVDHTLMLNESYPKASDAEYSSASAAIEEPESNRRERKNAGLGKWLCLGLEASAAAGALVANSSMPLWVAIAAGAGATAAVLWVIGSGLLTVTNMRPKIDRLPFLRRLVKAAVFGLILSAVPVFLLSRVQALAGGESDFWTDLTAVVLPLGLITMGLALVVLGASLHALHETLGWALRFLSADASLRHDIGVLANERMALTRGGRAPALVREPSAMAPPTQTSSMVSPFVTPTMSGPNGFQQRLEGAEETRA